MSSTNIPTNILPPIHTPPQLILTLWNSQTLSLKKYKYLLATYPHLPLHALVEAKPTLLTQQHLTHHTIYNKNNSLLLLHNHSIKLIQTHVDTEHILYLTLSHNNTPFSLLLTHLPNTLPEQITIMTTITKLLSLPTTPHVLLGDFNFTTHHFDSTALSPINQTLKHLTAQLTHSGMIDTAQTLFPNTQPTHFKTISQTITQNYAARRLDRCYTNTPHTPTQTIKTPSLSDHALITTTITLPPPKALTTKQLLSKHLVYRHTPKTPDTHTPFLDTHIGTLLNTSPHSPPNPIDLLYLIIPALPTPPHTPSPTPVFFLEKVRELSVFSPDDACDHVKHYNNATPNSVITVSNGKVSTYSLDEEKKRVKNELHLNRLCTPPAFFQTLTQLR